MYPRFLLPLIVLSLAASLARGDTYHAKPDPSAHGGIVGKIEPAEGLQTVVAFESTELKAYQGHVSAATGQFEFRGLPPGEYDLLIKAVGHAYEGITLEVDMDSPLTGAELAKVRDAITPMYFQTEDYFHIKKIIRLAANGEHARMIVMQTRTRPVVDPAANAIKASIRRFDFVDLIKTFKVWQITENRHLLRQEVPTGSADTKIEVTSSPALGGILVGEQVKDMGTIDLKKLPAPETARYTGAEFVGK